MARDPDALMGGDWRTAPELCAGTVEVWDQTVGCPECHMNLWHLPDQIYKLPHWAPASVVDALRAIREGGEWSYDPFFELFNMAHPFQFDDCQDPGDEDDGGWPGQELLLAALFASKVP